MPTNYDYIDAITEREELFKEYGKLIYRLQVYETEMNLIRVKCALIEDKLTNQNDIENESMDTIQ